MSEERVIVGQNLCGASCLLGSCRAPLNKQVRCMFPEFRSSVCKHLRPL